MKSRDLKKRPSLFEIKLDVREKSGGDKLRKYALKRMFRLLSWNSKGEHCD